MNENLNTDKAYLKKMIQLEREKHQAFAEILKIKEEGIEKEIIKIEQSTRMFRIRLLEQLYQKTFN